MVYSKVMGYAFWAKEYGCVFLENRKPAKPENVVYVPSLVLRDIWHLSKYCNLNKFQGTVQNKDRVNRSLSDAYKYSHAYTAAIPLMSTPLFFQETQFYSQEAKDEIRKVLSAYKAVRNSMYEFIVYPIGDEPSNASWTGFQAHHQKHAMGYLTLFREINNGDEQQSIGLRFLAKKTIEFTNLLNGNKEIKESVAKGFVKFNMAEKGGFKFLKYTY